VANGNYPRASNFYDIRELSGPPGSPEPGHKARWLIEVACFKCKATDQSIYPAPLNRVGRVTNTSGHRNVLLCQPCIDEIGGAFYY
jgi:hypothetical protein